MPYGIDYKRLKQAAFKAFAVKPVRAVLIAMVALCVAEAGQLPEFSRYRVILDKAPFGRFTPEPDLVDEVQPVFEKHSYVMCAAVLGPDGLRVGFLDTKVRPPKSYYLKVGGERDGFVLVDADFEQGTAVLLRKGLPYRQEMRR